MPTGRTMQNVETKIEIRLHDEDAVLEGTLSEVNNGKRRPPWRETVRWRCPCGTDVDTGAIPKDRLYAVTDGYCLQCPGCKRWYMHHRLLGYVEGVPKGTTSIAGELAGRMPDE